MVAPPAQRSLLRFFLDILPSLTLIILVLLAAAPLGAKFWPEIGPMLVLLAIFFWSSDAHNFLPYWMVFVIGVFLDILTGVPMGLYALTFLVVAGIAGTQKRTFAGKPFYLPWFGLSLISLMALTVNYGVNVIYYLRFFDPLPVLGQWLACIVIYPLMALILGIIRLRISNDVTDRALVR